MSIINEALKKAQENNQDRDIPALQTQQGPGENAIQHPGSLKKKPLAVSRTKKGKKFIFFIVIVIAGIGAIFILKPHPMTPEKIIPIAPVTEDLKSSFTPPTPSPAMPPMLNLNGIVYDEERPYAIVNNKVLLKGDIIEGATLMEINRDSVKFLFNDREVVVNAEWRNPK